MPWTVWVPSCFKHCFRWSGSEPVGGLEWYSPAAGNATWTQPSAVPGRVPVAPAAMPQRPGLRAPGFLRRGGRNRAGPRKSSGGSVAGSGAGHASGRFRLGRWKGATGRICAWWSRHCWSGRRRWPAAGLLRPDWQPWVQSRWYPRDCSCTKRAGGHGFGAEGRQGGRVRRPRDPGTGRRRGVSCPPWRWPYCCLPRQAPIRLSQPPCAMAVPWRKQPAPARPLSPNLR